MKDSQFIILSKADYERLWGLVKNTNTETSELLEDELNRAKIYDTEDIPDNVVSMNSVVSFVDQMTEKQMTVKLTFPGEVADADSHIKNVSILAPIGAALIGLQVGQSIEWPLPNGKSKTLKVESVIAAKRNNS